LRLAGQQNGTIATVENPEWQVLADNGLSGVARVVARSRHSLPTAGGSSQTLRGMRVPAASPLETGGRVAEAMLGG